VHVRRLYPGARVGQIDVTDAVGRPCFPGGLTSAAMWLLDDCTYASTQDAKDLVDVEH